MFIYKENKSPIMEEEGAYQCFNCRSIIGVMPAEGEMSNKNEYSPCIEFDCPVCGAENYISKDQFVHTIADKRLMISHCGKLELNPYMLKKDEPVSLDEFYSTIV